MGLYNHRGLSYTKNGYCRNTLKRVERIVHHTIIQLRGLLCFYD